MGMFDYIKCEAPLPDGFEGMLQTKDFGCEMTTHIITKEGRLMLDNGYHESVPKAERPNPDDEGILGLRGSVRRVHKYEDASFHGIVNFYGTDTDENWHEYNAKFTDGQLVQIDLAT